MKFALTVAASLTALVASNAHAEDYYLVGWSTQDTFVEFVDANTIKTKVGHVRQAWITTVYRPGAAASRGSSYDKNLREFDCEARMWIGRMMVEYTSDGGVLRSYTEPSYSSMSAVMPGSIAEGNYDFVCQYPDSVDDKRHVTVSEDIGSVGRRLLKLSTDGKAKSASK